MQQNHTYDTIMRSTKHTKIQKDGIRTKINKKKNARKSSRAWGFNNNVSTENLENINEVLRINKTQRAEGVSSWKLVPKDSCEVYKERRRKRLESQVRHSEESMTGQKSTSRNKSRSRDDKRMKKKPRNTRSRRRPHSDSSAHSRSRSRDSCSSMSTSSYASNSDMEY